jgi:hypothetical protein
MKRSQEAQEAASGSVPQTGRRLVPTSKEAPYFHALAVFHCKRNRLYRIYIRADELLFIWAGSGLTGKSLHGIVGAGHAAGGVLGGLLGVLIAKVLDRKHAARKGVLDATPLEQLIDDHPKNWRVPLNEFDEVRIRPRSWLFTDHEHQAILQLRHRFLGKYRLGIASLADLQVARTELPRVFGAVCRVEIA